jgi:hypothetical protein
MRIFAVAMLLPLIAAAFTLAPDAPASAGAAPSGTLDVDCGDGPAYAGVPMLVTCVATATNTGSQPLSNVTLTFMPSSQALLPNQYYFFSARLDGEDLDISGAPLTYWFSDLASGESSVLEIEIIIRSDHDYGADLVLNVGHARAELDRVALSTQVVDPPAQRVSAQLTLLGAGLEEPPPTREYDVELLNGTGAALGEATIELVIGSGVSLSSGDWRPAEFPGRYSHDSPSLAAGERAHLTFEVVPQADCVWAYPALVVRADGGPVAAAIADMASTVGECPWEGRGGGGAEPAPDAATRTAESDDVGITLPATGAGAASARGGGVGAVALAAGLLALAAGGSLRAARRR